MTVVNLIHGVGSAQTVANVKRLDGNSSGPNMMYRNVTPQGGSPPSYNESYQVILYGTTPGAVVTCAVQPVVSNDGSNWANFGGTLTASGSSTTIGGVAANSVTTAVGLYEYYGAFVSSLTGAATVDTLLSI